MKKVTFLLLSVFFIYSNSFAQDVWVNGYTRTNGTIVQDHYRTNRDQTVNNNFTTIGNTNPYTGAVGTLPRDNGYTIQIPQSSVNIPLIQSTLSAKQKNYTIEVTTPLDGGYVVPMILEQIREGEEWRTIKKEEYNGYLFFDKNTLYFKRGQSNWLIRNHDFVEYKSDKNLYVYNSEYGLTLLDDKLRFILFYDTSNNTKRYLYAIGDSVSSIVPTN
ncbi:hypothetical protein [Flavobacterium sp. 140616W15]|uniref:hypothetical protein n=1 Tax=Flavobacterium sp. 140616W15 TaxID=2478552 RepID=UPI001A934B80|nr:hypothetical protein [Flavobacterium sp. 140616W15]